MKKTIVFLVTILTLSSLAAFSFDLGGEFRTRAAMYNDVVEDNGGHIDNRLQLYMTGEFNPEWSLTFNTEIGDIRWGAGGGGIGTNGVNIETSELYLQHNWLAKNISFKLGQQYFADHRSMVIDDYFSGLMITAEDLAGMRAELAYIKAAERLNAINDDYHVVMFNLYMDDLNAGLQTFYGNDLKATGMANFTVMPFITLPAGPAELDLTAFVEYQINKGPADEEISFGGAVAATLDGAELGVEGMDMGIDFLYIGENGITELSSYYQNGLYLFGFGPWHDGVTVAWPYPFGNDGMMSAVGSVGYGLNQKTKLFANAGYLTTFAANDPGVGLELNAGVEYCLIPNTAKLAIYGAFGMPGDQIDNDPNALYLLGSTIKVVF